MPIRPENNPEFVYRIQDADGRGPWKPGFSHRWVEERADLSNLPPWFVEFGRVDRRVIYGAHCGSACKTLEQLRRWFTRVEYEKLESFGYRAVKMKVNRILASSNIQCFIERAKPLKEELEIIKLY